MKYSIPLTALAVAASLVLWGCNNEKAAVTEKAPIVAPAASTPAPQAAAAPGGYTGKVVETMNASGYTYVQVDTGSEKIWAAAPAFTVAVGDEVTVPPSAPMANYHSKTLDRTFDVVYFAGSIYPVGSEPSPASAIPAGMGSGGMPSGHPATQGAPAPTDVDLTGIPKAEGGNSVGELLGDMAAYGGKEVLLRGKVVKYNSGIMGKNWLHVRDGSGEAGANDITVTTQAAAKVGDTVLVKGVAVTDKDFGAGYKYAFIIEDAAVTVE